MANRGMLALVVVMALIIVALAVVLFMTPTPVSAPTIPAATSTGGTTPPAATSTQPLSSRVTVTSPKRNAAVGQTFVVFGSAPGNWYFEASFPIQVRNPAGDVIGRGIAQAQGEWMTTDLVTFTSTITLSNATYRGPATLILLRDNPSGLPENDDSVEIPIVIQ